jgi:hypothetical protein
LATYISPNGNPEVWHEKPAGYCTAGEWAATHPPTPEEMAEQRKAEIITRLAEIDIASIRPLRAIADNTATDFDREKLADLEAEAAALRTELAELTQTK